MTIEQESVQRQPETEQDLWREEKMFAAYAFIAALDTAEAAGPIGEGLKIATLTSFTRSIFGVMPRDVEEEEHVYQIDVKRPDGRVRRAVLASGGYGGLTFEGRTCDVLADGSEVNVEQYDERSIRFLDIAQDLAY